MPNVWSGLEGWMVHTSLCPHQTCHALIFFSIFFLILHHDFLSSHFTCRLKLMLLSINFLHRHHHQWPPLQPSCPQTLLGLSALTIPPISLNPPPFPNPSPVSANPSIPAFLPPFVAEASSSSLRYFFFSSLFLVDFHSVWYWIRYFKFFSDFVAELGIFLGPRTSVV